MKDMTLTQEYLVCAVNEKGKIGSMNIEKVVCLLAAGLLELQLAECITMDQKAATVTAPLPQDKEYLRSLYDYIGSGKGGSIKMDKLLESYTYSLSSKQVRALMGGIGGELEKMGLATRTPATLLSNEGFAPVKGALDGVIDLVRSELLEEGEVTEDIAALVILLEKAGIIKNYFSPYERGQMKDRLKAIVRSPQGRQVGRMVEYVEGMLSIMPVLMVMYQ